jgi:hypothetical protein
VLEYVVADEILDHGQQLDLRTRRGADFSLKITQLVSRGPDVPLDITGASVVGRIASPGLPDIAWNYVVDGPAGVLTVSVPAGRTLAMVQDWTYTLGMKLAGVTTPLLFGSFRVSQEPL